MGPVFPWGSVGPPVFSWGPVCSPGAPWGPVCSPGPRCAPLNHPGAMSVPLGPQGLKIQPFMNKKKGGSRGCGTPPGKVYYRCRISRFDRRARRGPKYMGQVLGQSTPPHPPQGRGPGRGSPGRLFYRCFCCVLGVFQGNFNDVKGFKLVYQYNKKQMSPFHNRLCLYLNIASLSANYNTTKHKSMQTSCVTIKLDKISPLPVTRE